MIAFAAVTVAQEDKIGKVRQGLVGVHALTMSNLVPGKTQDPADPWRWVASTSDAAGAPIKPVWKQIEQIMGAPATRLHLVSNDFNADRGGGGVLVGPPWSIMKH